MKTTDVLTTDDAASKTIVVPEHMIPGDLMLEVRVAVNGDTIGFQTVVADNLFAMFGDGDGAQIKEFLCSLVRIGVDNALNNPQRRNR